MIPVVLAAVGLAAIADGGDKKLWIKSIPVMTPPWENPQSWKVEVYEGNTVIGRGSRVGIGYAAVEAMVEAEKSIWGAKTLSKETHQKISRRSPLILDIQSRLYEAFMAMPILKNGETSPYEERDREQVKRSLIRNGWFIEDDLLCLMGEGLSAEAYSKKVDPSESVEKNLEKNINYHWVRIHAGSREIGFFPHPESVGYAAYIALGQAESEGNWPREELYDIVIGALVRAGVKPIDYRGLAARLGWFQ